MEKVNQRLMSYRQTMKAVVFGMPPPLHGAKVVTVA
jgi:hypothetical protein